MISVAMTTYNSSKYLLEQLDSIVVQTVPVDEVVIVDDCSLDDTVSILNTYIHEHKLKNWKVIRHNRNQGFIRSFRDALSYTTGDVVLLCDHDDVWKTTKVQIIKEQFTKEPEIGFLATGFERIDSDGRLMTDPKRKGYSNNDLIRRKVALGQLNKMRFQDVAIYNISPGCTCALSQAVLKEYLDTNVASLPHDWAMALIAACKERLYYLDIPTTYYRIYGSNAIGLGHQKNFETRKRIGGINLEEKRDMVSIVEKYKGTESQEYLYMEKIYSIFMQRCEWLNSGRIFPAAISLFLKTLRCGRLYETIMVDIISFVKYKRG